MDPKFSTIPIPRDLALPLPLGQATLQLLLLLFFLGHILFVNLMVGGSVLVSFFELLGYKDKKWDQLAAKIANTVTVNKSLAVVLGIGPLLCINLLYTLHWYSASSLTGHAWLILIPLVITVFLLTYLHKYTWEAWAVGGKKQLHLITGIVSTLIFLFIPLIFLANINLMLFPETWHDVRGFFSSLSIGNVFPRYLHFILASISVTFLFLVGAVRYRQFGIAKIDNFHPAELTRIFYKGVAYPTLLQFIAGPLVLFTLPKGGLSQGLIWTIGCGVAVGVVLLWTIRREIHSTDAAIGKRFWHICGLMSLVVLSMGTGRARYRYDSLALHKELIDKRTESFEKSLQAFQAEQAARPAGQEADSNESGEKLFAACGACHAAKTRLVGPPLTEIAQIYSNNPDGIVAWAKAPGKKRPDFPQMPPMAHLSDENLKKIAIYILSVQKPEEAGER